MHWRLFGCVLVCCALLHTIVPSNAVAQTVDCHQHLYSPEAGKRSGLTDGINAEDLIRELDKAGIKRAVALSAAYSLSNPNKPTLVDEYAKVRAENDWTAAQVHAHSDRLTGFCSVNPLRPFALEEIDRCAKDPNLRTGLKLHFGNSDVDVDNPEDLAKLRKVFREANTHRMALIVHMHANVDHHRPYGAREALIFLREILPQAPDVTVQIAHLAGAGGYDDPGDDDALSVFIVALQQNDPRVRNLYFDVSGLAIPGTWEDKSALLAKRLRQIGPDRLLYGSDASVPGNRPAEALKRWHQLPLTQSEFRRIESHIPPYLGHPSDHEPSRE
ncbi:amidohydrolase family protein [Terriglobus roseus]|uniref:Predicted metal-dependent hydrolase, TIM-barrel fold n=1 Tax=Terriglobus roseus TaxID=392734 RepID=A0A1G7H7Y3_9BACT|nr:amidohydrolase family protein [Terriglobus roseus]SDE96433.1 Predicted metal-dependent hydrolase, TIM-barrel fold [Terriglobus roseus]